jgi:hypothetical protein
MFATPEEAAARVKAYAGDAPVDTVWFCASVAGMPSDMVAQHVRTICTKVRPLLQEDYEDIS